MNWGNDTKQEMEDLPLFAYMTREMLKNTDLAEFWQVKIILKTTMIYHGLNLVNAQITEERRIPFCDVNADDWELVLDNHIDWDYVVKNKCLCWFSDEDIEEPNFADRLLAIVENESGVKYMTEGKVTFVYCRPVCKDEVTFYEDKRDGNN